MGKLFIKIMVQFGNEWLQASGIKKNISLFYVLFSCSFLRRRAKFQVRGGQGEERVMGASSFWTLFLTWCWQRWCSNMSESSFRDTYMLPMMFEPIWKRAADLLFMCKLLHSVGSWARRGTVMATFIHFPEAADLSRTTENVSVFVGVPLQRFPEPSAFLNCTLVSLRILAFFAEIWLVHAEINLYHNILCCFGFF